MKKYPRIGKRQQERGRRCCLCSKKTTGTVEIQFDHMRGNDDVVPCCDECQRLPNLAIIIIERSTPPIEKPMTETDPQKMERDVAGIFDTLTPQGKRFYETHTRYEQVSDGWNVWFDSGPQHLRLSPVVEDKQQAIWYRLMLARALDRVAQGSPEKESACTAIERLQAQHGELESLSQLGYLSGYWSKVVGETKYCWSLHVVNDEEDTTHEAEGATPQEAASNLLSMLQEKTT